MRKAFAKIPQIHLPARRHEMVSIRCDFPLYSKYYFEAHHGLQSLRRLRKLTLFYASDWYFPGSGGGGRRVWSIPKIYAMPEFLEEVELVYDEEEQRDWMDEKWHEQDWRNVEGFKVEVDCQTKAARKGEFTGC